MIDLIKYVKHLIQYVVHSAKNMIGAIFWKVLLERENKNPRFQGVLVQLNMKQSRKCSNCDINDT